MKNVKEMLPNDLQPKKPVEEVVVPITLTKTLNYTPEQIEHIARRAGLMNVSLNRMAALPELGEIAQELGVIKTIKGATIIGQEAIVACINSCSAIVADETGKYKAKQKEEARKAIGYLAEKLAKLNKSVVDVDATVAEVVIKADVKHRRSFGAGMAVRSPKAKQSPTTPTG